MFVVFLQSTQGLFLKDQAVCVCVGGRAGKAQPCSCCCALGSEGQQWWKRMLVSHWYNPHTCQHRAPLPAAPRHSLKHSPMRLPPYLQGLHWFRLSCRRKSTCLSLASKALQGQASVYLSMTLSYKTSLLAPKPVLHLQILLLLAVFPSRNAFPSPGSPPSSFTY